MKEDPILGPVTKKLKKAHKCFYSLSPSAALSSRQPLGHQLAGVARLMRAAYAAMRASIFSIPEMKWTTVDA